MAEIKTGKRRALRWAGWIALALVLIVFLGFLTWIHVEENALQRRIDTLRAAGEPMLPVDFVPSVADGDDNSANDLRAATKLLNEESEAYKAIYRNELGPPLRPDERELIAVVLNESRDALALVDIAMTKPRCEWGYVIRSPVLTMVHPELNGVRALANRCNIGALLAHELGDDAAALARVDRIMFLSRAIAKHPSLVGYLVSTGCGAIGASTVTKLAPDLRIGASTGSARPEAVRQVIDQLLDDKPNADGFRHGMRAERMAALDTMITPGAPMTAAGFTTRARWLFRPMIAANATVIVDHVSGMIPIADVPNLAAARAQMPKLSPKVKGGSSSPYYMYAQILLPSLDRTCEVRFRYQVELRFAATALAIRWYATEHDGRLPQRLQDLVPKYLPAVPLDPLAASEQPIGYKPDANNPVLYSVGMNGTDEGGSEKGVSSRKSQSVFTEWECEDRVHHLSRQPRPPKTPNED